MSKQEVVEKFRNHGINVDIEDSATDALQALKDHNPDTLWPVLEDFTNGPIGLNFANEAMHTYTLSYALVNAFEQGKDSITQEDVDDAFDKAAKLADSLAPNGSTRADPDGEAVEGEQNGEAVTRTVKRKKDNTLMPLIESIVQDNAKESNEAILSMVLEQRPNAKENTVRAYISKARSNLGLKVKGGKRGRKSSGIYEKIRDMIKANADMPRAELIEKIVNELDAKPGTAQAYYSKAKKELNL